MILMAMALVVKALTPLLTVKTLLEPPMVPLALEATAEEAAAALKVMMMMAFEVWVALAVKAL